VSAAFVATLGDGMLLWVSNAGRMGFDLPAPPFGALTAGTYFGALAILLYAVGYWQVAYGLMPAGERLARWVFILGASTAGVGAVIHGMTGAIVRYEAPRGGDVSPATVITYLLPLWVLGSVSGVLAAVLYTYAILRRHTRYPRWMAGANMGVLPVLIGGLSFAPPATTAGLPASGSTQPRSCAVFRPYDRDLSLKHSR
jgi:hypothetical protein